jgi:hypothetical protein
MVCAGSALKLIYMMKGGIQLWNTANETQSIGLTLAPIIVLLRLKTGENAATGEVPRYVPPRQAGLRIADLKPKGGEGVGATQHGHRSPLGIALEKIDKRKRENDTPGEEAAFAAHEPPESAAEHCNAG